MKTRLSLFWILVALLIPGFLHAQAQTNACSQASPKLIAPAEEATGIQSPVNLEWSAVDGAEGYRVSIVEENFDIDVIAETSRTTVSARLQPGEYGWFVEAFFDNCESTVSEIHVFEMVRAESCSDSVPTLLTPSEGAKVTSQVTFSWTPVPGAIAYEVTAALDGGERAFVGETSATSLTAHLGEGRVTWAVDAEFNGCDDTISAEASFDIPVDPACGNDAPFLIAPGHQSTDVPTSVDFIWTPVEAAKSYSVLIVTDDGEDVRTLGTTGATRLRASVPAGLVFWAVKAEFESCPPEVSPISVFEASSPLACSTPKAPDIHVDPQALSGDSYLLIWSPGLSTGLYEVQEATREDFSDATTRTVNDIVLALSHQVSETTRYYYRVRSLSSCGRGVGPYSDTAKIGVLSPAALSINDAEVAASYVQQSVVVQRVRIPGSVVPLTFTAHADKPWLTVSPPSGTLPPEGIELTVTARPQDLAVGTNTATILLTYSGYKRRAARTQSALPTSVPVSVNLATPVSPDAGNSPLPASLIIPTVAHLEGAGVRWESDVRIVNTSAQVMKYLLNFTPSRTDGTKNGQQTTSHVEPGATAAFDDILRNFFGFAAAGESVTGVLEIRPLSTSSTGVPATPNVTLASSRTYALTAGGTIGEFIPAIPFSQFIGKSKDPNKAPSVLSLQHIAQSSAYRTNVGLLEASGEPASVLLTVFGDEGQRLGSFPIDLEPGEHMQLNAFLQSKEVSIDNGRIEVSVTSPTGKVTAFASVIDNETGDFTFVSPVDLSKPGANRVILPGIADTSAALWRSDIRLFNAGLVETEVTLTFIPQGSSTGTTRTASVKAGQVLQIDQQIDHALKSLVDTADQEGSVIVTTEGGGHVVATARTFYRTDRGTYGQSIPGVSAAEGVGIGNRALQILQGEESERFRTNLGIVELTGNPATVEISVSTPDSKFGAKTQLSLRPNEFRQIDSVLRQFGFGTTYNARITVKVVSGSGTVSAYGSLIDKRTNDPTYVPAL